MPCKLPLKAKPPLPANKLMTNYQKPQPKQTLEWSLGKRWLLQSIALFQVMQKQWYSTIMVVGFTVLFLSMVSGEFALLLLMLCMPMVTAWFYIHCRHRQFYFNEGQWLPRHPPLAWSLVWQQLKTRFNDLLVLGLIAVVINYAMYFVQLGLMNLWQLAPLTQELVQQMTIQEAFLRMFINLLTGLPLALLMAFSPALIMFNNNNPFNAMILSVKTVLTAWKPLLSLTIWMFLLMLAASFIVGVINTLLTAFFGGGAGSVIMLLFIFIMMGFVFSVNFVSYDALFPNDSEPGTTADDNQTVYTEI